MADLLTPAALAEIRRTYKWGDPAGPVNSLLAHCDAQSARIAELEDTVRDLRERDKQCGECALERATLAHESRLASLEALLREASDHLRYGSAGSEANVYLRERIRAALSPRGEGGAA